MDSQKTRENYLHYFQERGHTRLPSSPLLPHDDPTLLFTNAGMNQFKDLFLGHRQASYKRAVTSQKCLRVGGKHNDLENVGHTARHLTFFEMLGNFSFGDYFKEAAIAYAWEVATEIFGFPAEKIWPSVFETDEEAFKLWTRYVPASRIVRMGEKDNFWAMGETGPCGPCSELYLDRGDAHGPGTSPKDDPTGDRFIEFWNLVFMQYNRTQDGVLHPLPNPSIDTGSGLERVMMLKSGVDTVFETDILRSLINGIEKHSGLVYKADDDKLAPAFRVIADHLRTLSFAIADGVQPGNVDRGYVLRKVLRRAVRYGKNLGFEKPFLADILPTLVAEMGEDYPELKTHQSIIADVLTQEEEGFFRTLKRGGNLLREVIENAGASHLISGSDAFKLKDTYGLPVDEIVLLAKDSNLKVDLDGFAQLEKEARERSKQSQKTTSQEVSPQIYQQLLNKVGATTFTGYGNDHSTGKVVALMKNGELVDRLSEGDEGAVLLDQTPFYAEMGGQSGDKGLLECKAGRFQVQTTKSPFTGLTFHYGVMKEGSLEANETITATLDAQNRRKVEKNHSATHLLHYALAQVLGDHIKQAGSLVEGERLRFDFNHHKPLSAEEIASIEGIINRLILQNVPVKTEELSYNAVKGRSDIKQFFGEKYGEKVRVVQMGPSIELCGGTHAQSTGTLGLLKIVKEGSIASGVRRIEAVTGEEALLHYRNAEATLLALEELLKGSGPTLVTKVKSLLEENKNLQKDLKEAKRLELKNLLQALPAQKTLVTTFDVSQEELKEVAELLAADQRFQAFLITTKEGQVSPLILRINEELVAKGHNAADLLKKVAAVVDGSAGGRPNLAQGVMKNRGRFEEASKLFLSLIG